MTEKRRKLAEDEKFMQFALRMAVKGAGCVSPNPMVGAIAVKDGKVLAKAYHKRFGDMHAETSLLSKLAPQQANGATIYVNLEPCCHHGKTAPCTSALISAGVKRVVIAQQDPNPLVNGKGMEQLRNAGIDVLCGVCESEARRLNAPFNTFITAGRPWILLKVAQSIDGRIALANGQSRWITGESSRTEVHRIRTRLDAVLVGVQTIIDDDPELNVRLAKGRNPIRVIADSRLRIPESSRVLAHKDKKRTWILTTDGVDDKKIGRLKKAGVSVIVCAAAPNGRVDFNDALRRLADLNVASILVEGGGTIHAALLSENLWDELIVAIAPIIIGSEGRPGIGELNLTLLENAPRFKVHKTEQFEEDYWFYLERNVYGNC